MAVKPANILYINNLQIFQKHCNNIWMLKWAYIFLEIQSVLMIWCCVCFNLKWGKIFMLISGWHMSLSGLMIMTQIFKQQLFGWNFAKLSCSFHYKVKFISIIRKVLRTSLISAKPIAGKWGKIGIKILTIMMIWTACLYLKSHLLEISLVCLTSREFAFECELDWSKL